MPRQNLPGPSDKRRNVPFIIISLLFHFLLVLSFLEYSYYLASVAPVKTPQQEPTIQFVDMADLEKMRGEIVELDESDIAKTKPKDSKFLSDKNRLVEKETKSMIRGDFKNKKKSQASAPKAPQAAQESAPAVAQDKSPEMQTFAHGDMIVGKKAKEKPKKARSFSDLRVNNVQDMSQTMASQTSSTNDYLKDVVAGAETHLNTRAFLYFTYFNRIKKKLREHWEPLIQKRVRDLMRTGRAIASQEAKVTRLVITLDDHGGLSRVQVATTSGLQDLDETALEALRISAPFPNPPKDLIENGYVRIHWDFILES